MTRKHTIAVTLSAGLAGLAGVLRFALRGYDVIALIVLAVAALVLLRAFAGGAAFKAATALACVLVLAVALTEVPIVANSKTDAGDGVRYLVVLGARVDEGGDPSLSLRCRLEAALDYLDSHPDTRAVLSGGQGDDEPVSEAACMHAWLVARGVASERLTVEDKSTNTYENLRNSLALVGDAAREPGAVAVVSSSYHLFRAKLIAASLGVEVSGVAARPGTPLVALNYFIREAPAIWKQLLLGAR